MLYKEIAINPHDGFDLLAVWEKDGRKWHLLRLARPQSAIASSTAVGNRTGAGKPEGAAGVKGGGESQSCRAKDV